MSELPVSKSSPCGFIEKVLNAGKDPCPALLLKRQRPLYHKPRELWSNLIYVLIELSLVAKGDTFPLAKTSLDQIEV